ncbi:hypothetical protein FLL45_19570 [Aliikangiella marina]|uniref:Aerotolerance regulator N-terminal domain-containing protein n=1 Tax=Aliikangiella marina TaxID=1712262 RepID=A0A545T583_9GAMM|nr:BatA domain-containing protein [Aliikangiella marina]TQV72410.1 hypothetical protein FLL45_19570 [Aliikangiella marina]
MANFSVVDTLSLGALAAISIPILIHLFNRTRGKIVWFGHVELIKQAKKIKVTELKVTQWVLLLLRIFIFTALALLLAGLFFNQDADIKDRVNLVSPEWVVNSNEVDFNNLSVDIDANSFWLTPEFNSIPMDWEAAKEKAQAILADRKRNFSLQTLLLAWESKSIFANKTHVYAVNDLAQFSSSRVDLERNYQYHFKPTIDEADNSTVPLKVIVFFDANRQIDQQVLASSFKYLNDLTNNRYMVSFRPLDSLEPNASIDSDVLIYLADMELPQNIIEYTQKGGYLISDGITQNSTSGLRLINPQGRLIRLFKTTIVELKDTHEMLWQDKLGIPLLIAHEENHIQWLSRFRPDWTDWVKRPNFPIDLERLITRNIELESYSVNETAVPLPRLNELLAENKLDHKDVFEKKELSHWLLLLIALLWAIERWLSEKRFIKNNANLADDSSSRVGGSL